MGNSTGAASSDVELMRHMVLIDDRKKWDDATHLKNEYERNTALFLNKIVEFCIMLNLNMEQKELRNGQFYDIIDQNGEEQHADITKSYQEDEKNKLISVLPFNNITKATARFLYSPSLGVNLEYSAEFIKGNKTFGQEDYFGSAIQAMIQNISMASSKVSFDTRISRHKAKPYGLESFCVASKSFMDREQMLDAFGIVGTLDAFVRGMHTLYAVGGASFQTPYERELFRYVNKK